MNSKLCDITGYPADELLSMTFYDVTHPDDREENRATFERFVADGASDHLAEKRYVRRDGTVIWVKVAASIVRRTGQPVRTVAVVEDITSAKAANEKLARSEEELRAVFDAAPVGIWLAHDPSCHLVTGNRFGDRLLGMTPGTNVSATPPVGAPRPGYRALSEGRDLAGCELPLQRAAASGQPVRDAEFEIIRADGRRIFFLGGAIPLRDANGAVRGAVAACLDITEWKRTAAALRERETELRLALAAGCMGSFAWDIAAGRFRWSAEHFTLLGLEPGSIEPTYGAWRERVHSEDVVRVEQELRRAMREREAFVAEYRIVRADGAVRWVEARGRFESDGEGQLVRMSGVMVDIHDRKIAEESARRTEARFAQLANSVADVFWIPNPAGPRVEYVSPAFERVWGLPVTRVLQDFTVWQNTVHPDDRMQVADAPARVVKVGHHEVEYRIVRPDGEVRWINDRGSVMPDGFIAGIASDVTERKRSEIECETLLMHAQQTNRAKDEFLAMLGHELRNPLAAVRNAVITAHLDSSTRERALAIARRQSENLGRLVDDLLDVSRITRGQITLRQADVSLATVIERAVDGVRAHRRARACTGPCRTPIPGQAEH